MVSETQKIIQVLKYKFKGNDVKTIQTYLNEKLKLSLIVDGIFSPKTKQAVINFQLINNLVSDGIVGTLTRGKMK